jgi:sirohydrochlorin cobaltochelatase
MSPGGLVLLGHGSRDAEGAAEYLALAATVRAALPTIPVEAGVLEFAGPVAPSIADAFARCVARGARRIVAAPALLHCGGHATDDMPSVVAAARRQFSGVEIRLAQPLAGHPALLDLAADRCRAATTRPAAATTVLLVGRGTTSARANADLFATARLFQEREQYQSVEVCFVSLAPPCVPAGLRRCVALGAKHVVVAPYFINTGRLVRRIATQVDAACLFYPDTETVVAAHFGPSSRLAAALLEQAHAAWPDVIPATSLTDGPAASPSLAPLLGALAEGGARR